MTTDVSRLSFDEAKHFLGVQLQQGRVQLDADWNEQSELWLRLVERLGGDTAGTGSPNHGFRVDAHVLLDALDSSAGWRADFDPAQPVQRLFVDFQEPRTGAGSLCVEGADAILRRLEAPRDMTGLREVVFHVRGTFAAPDCVFFLEEGGNRAAFPTAEEPAPAHAGVWRSFRAALPAGPLAIDLAAVDGYGFESLDPGGSYCFDALKADLPIRDVLVSTASLRAFQASSSNPADKPALRRDDDARVFGETAVRVGEAEEVAVALPAPRDLGPVRRLWLAVRSSGAPLALDVTLVDATPAGNDLSFALAPPAAASEAGFDLYAFDLPQRPTVSALRFESLQPAETYWLGPVLAELDLAGNLVVMGGDGTPAGAGRFYGDGLAARKERHETYRSQRDLPDADTDPLTPLADDTCRSDLAYLDLWERPITYLEDPLLREPALEGIDTCTRTQLVAQVRLLAGDLVALPPLPAPPVDAGPPLAAFAALPRCGDGVLTTKDKPDAVLDPCADPCEPEVEGTFTGEENRLFRVEIHTPGAVGPAGPGTARFKWSRENGAAASALVEDAPAGAFAVRVEKPELFGVGDFVELRDDLDDLVSGPHKTLRSERGALRRVTAIDLQDKRVSFEDATAADPALHAALPRRYDRLRHAKLRRWDGVAPATPGDIVLADGVVIELGGTDLIPGDYWVFTTRVAGHAVERLVEAPPRGVCHRHYKLAVIRRSKRAGEPERLSVEDCRPAFRALSALRAADVAFDAAQCRHADAAWQGVDNVQTALDTLCRLDRTDELKRHNKLLHGYGVVCGLKVRCGGERERVIVEPGYALDCEGCGIELERNRVVELVRRATDDGLLDDVGNGDVQLVIERGAAASPAIRLERAPAATGFWDGVLEGTLIKDFWDGCVQNLLDLFERSFLPIPATAVPVPDSQKLLASFINLLWQLVNPATGGAVWLAPGPGRGHEQLRRFYEALRAELQSETFCAMFDDARPFPDYPDVFPDPPGIDTAFGLFGFHTRLRLHPSGRFAYTCGVGNEIHVYDLEARELVEVLEFPGDPHIQVLDVAFSADDGGATLHAVGVLNNEDSIFASASADPVNRSHVFGPSSVVCELEFVRLVTSAAQPANLYALARGEGLYIFDPAAIPPRPTADVAFNATGLLEPAPDGGTLFAGEASAFPIGSPQDRFDRVRSVDLAVPAGAPVLFAVQGRNDENDLLAAAGVLYATGDPDPGHTRTLRAFDAGSGAAQSATDLEADTPTRLAALPGRDLLLVVRAGENKLVRVDVAGAPVLDTNFRIPVQVLPADIAVRGDEAEAYVLNLVGTLSVLDLGAVLDAAPPPAYALEPSPPLFVDPLAEYRQEILDAYADLLKGFGQYLKDCFVDKFLVDCPECGPDDVVVLGSVEVRNFQVYNVCNFDRRHYVKSFRTYGYWLSTVPVLPLVKKSFAELACRVLP